MEETKVNCSKCAYAEKTEDGMRCLFHDADVTEQNRCKYFFDEFESPQMVHLLKEMAEEGAKEKTAFPRFTPKDIFAYILTAVISVPVLWFGIWLAASMKDVL